VGPSKGPSFVARAVSKYLSRDIVPSGQRGTRKPMEGPQVLHYKCYQSLWGSYANGTEVKDRVSILIGLLVTMAMGPTGTEGAHQEYRVSLVHPCQG
jgi:hypothetical protein